MAVGLSVGIFVGEMEGWLTLGELVGTEDRGLFVGIVEGEETVGFMVG